MDENLDKKSPASPSSPSFSRSKSPMSSVWNQIRNLFSNKTTAIAAVLVLILGVGATIIAVQRSTEFRQHADTGTNVGNQLAAPTVACGGYGDVNADGKIDVLDVSLANNLKNSTPNPNDFTDTSRRMRAHVTWDGTSSTTTNVTDADITQIGNAVHGIMPDMFPACRFAKPLPRITDKVGCFYGDVDNDKRITFLDAYITNWMNLHPGSPVISSWSIPIADVSNDGVADSTDEFQMKQYALGTRTSFTKQCVQKPIPTACIVGTAKYGDVDNDGVISTMDSWEILYSDLAKSPIFDFVAANADIDGQTGITPRDSQYLLAFLNGAPLGGGTMTKPFPVCTASPTTAVTQTPAPTLAPKPLVCGNLGDVDNDGRISTNDELEILRNAAVLPSTTFISSRGDVNGDGIINGGDALVIGSYLAGTVSTFPACTSPTVTSSALCPNGNVRFDSSSHDSTSDWTIHSLTWYHTVGNAANRMLIVGVNLRTSSGGFITGVTFAGRPLSRLGSSISGTIDNEIWYLLNPPSTTDKIVVTANNSLTISAGASSWSNVAQVAPFGPVVNQGTTANPNVNGIPPTCGAVVDNLATGPTTCAASPNDNPAQVQYWNVSVPNSQGGGGAGTGAGSYKIMQLSSPATSPFIPLSAWNMCSSSWILKATAITAFGAVPPTTPTTTPVPPTPTPTHLCDITPVNCSTICTPTTSNTCQTNNGLHLCTATQYSGGGTCTQRQINFPCTVNNCTLPKVCSNTTSASSSTATCVNPSVTGTATNTPTPTVHVAGTATPTITGAATSTPTPTTATGHTMLALTLGLDGIGNATDNAARQDPQANHPEQASNQSPHHTQRNVAIQIFDANNNLVDTVNSTVNYDSTGTKLFKGTVDLGTTITNGNYTIKVKSPGYLNTRIPGIITLTHGQTYNSLRVDLIAGNVNNDTAINVTDYNIIRGCQAQNSSVCTAELSPLADLNDDGQINNFDSNLLIRELSGRSEDQ